MPRFRNLPERNDTQRLLPSRAGLECVAGFSPSLSRSLHGESSPAPLAVALFFYGEEASSWLGQRVVATHGGVALSRFGCDGHCHRTHVERRLCFASLVRGSSRTGHSRFQILESPDGADLAMARSRHWINCHPGFSGQIGLFRSGNRAGCRQLSANITEKEDSSRTHCGALCFAAAVSRRPERQRWGL